MGDLTGSQSVKGHPADLRARCQSEGDLILRRMLKKRLLVQTHFSRETNARLNLGQYENPQDVLVIITITHCSCCLAPPDGSRCRTNKQADDNDDDEVKKGRTIAALIIGSAAERTEISACAILIPDALGAHRTQEMPRLSEG